MILDMSNKLMGEEFWGIFMNGFFVFFDEVKKYFYGKVFDVFKVYVVLIFEGWEGCFDIGNDVFMKEFEEVYMNIIYEWEKDYEFWMISWCLLDIYNLFWYINIKLIWRFKYNLVFMNLEDVDCVGVKFGDVIKIIF